MYAGGEALRSLEPERRVGPCLDAPCFNQPDSGDPARSPESGLDRDQRRPRLPGPHESIRRQPVIRLEHLDDGLRPAAEESVDDDDDRVAEFPEQQHLRRPARSSRMNGPSDSIWKGREPADAERCIGELTGW